MTLSESILTTSCKHQCAHQAFCWHYCDVIMSAMASQIISLTIVYQTVYSGADQRKPQSSTSLAFVMGIHRWPGKSPHKGPVTQKMFPFDDVIIDRQYDSCLMWNHIILLIHMAAPRQFWTQFMHYIKFPSRIFCRRVPGFATDCPCGVWCRGLTTCLLYVGPPLEF